MSESEIKGKRVKIAKNEHIKASRSVTLSIDRIQKVQEFCNETERSFSSGIDFLVGKGLYYVRVVEKNMNAAIDRKVELRLREKDQKKN